MKKVLCRCGEPAYFNSVTNEWELCSKCKRAVRGGNEVLRDIGFGKKYTSATLDDFSSSFCNTLLKDTDSFKNNLLMSGDSSVGKTHLMASIADYLLCGSVNPFEIRYVNMVDLCLRIGADITELNGIVNDCSTCKYLFLDEIVPVKTQWEERMIYMILETRRNEELVTISATNCAVDKIDGRIKSRLLDNNGVNYNLTRNVWRKK